MNLPAIFDGEAGLDDPVLDDLSAYRAAQLDSEYPIEHWHADGRFFLSLLINGYGDDLNAAYKIVVPEWEIPKLIERLAEQGLYVEAWLYYGTHHSARLFPCMHFRRDI